jgi:hypothetical protein
MLCKKCNTIKETTEFYKNGQAECKNCIKKRVRERELLLRQDPEWLEKEKERHRAKYFRLGYKDKHKPTTEKKRETIKKYRQKYPEKQKATTATKKMKPQTEGNELHHWSYNKEHFKDVIEITPTDHAKTHRYMIYDAERKMYRRADNNILLDTKESHIEFINSLKDKI